MKSIQATNQLTVLYPEDIRMLIDFGVLDPRADEFTAYTLMGKLMRALREHTWALPRDPEFPAMADRKYVGEYQSNYGSLHAAVACMSRAEKDALRDRIFALCAPRTSPNSTMIS